jgi:hypothetical protein
MDLVEGRHYGLGARSALQGNDLELIARDLPVGGCACRARREYAHNCQQSSEWCSLWCSFSRHNPAFRRNSTTSRHSDAIENRRLSVLSHPSEPNGVQGVAGSNPAVPIRQSTARKSHGDTVLERSALHGVAVFLICGRECARRSFVSGRGMPDAWSAIPHETTRHFRTRRPHSSRRCCRTLGPRIRCTTMAARKCRDHPRPRTRWEIQHDEVHAHERRSGRACGFVRRNTGGGAGHERASSHRA